MDSVFRSAREKLEKEHRERKETGKLKLEREKKDKEAAERQRQAVEASQRARRLEAIESQMMKVEDNLSEETEDVRCGDCIIQAIPPWMKTNMPQRIAKENDEDVFEWDDAEGSEWEVGDAPGTGNCKRFTWNVRAPEEEKNKTTAAGKNTESKWINH